jgi:prepilin-type processing-associated H-X9-DG protein
VELLVVIAIIALLLAILLPSLKAAREAARATVCLSQVRQINIGSQNYALDNRGFFRASRVWTFGSYTDVARMYYAWPGEYRANMDGATEAVFNCPSAPVEFWWTQTMDAANIFARIAPSAEYQPARFGYDELEVPISATGIRKPRPDVSQVGLTYGYNDAGVDAKVWDYGYMDGGRRNFGLGWSVNGHVSGWDGVNIASIVDPADMIAFGDAASDGDCDASLGAWTEARWSIPARRHSGRSNIAFVDGHAVGERSEELLVQIPTEPPAGEPAYGSPRTHPTADSRARRWNNDHKPHRTLWLY